MTAVYSQVAEGRLYASSASADAGLAGYWSGYLAGNGSTLGATASLAETWGDPGGTYLFLGATPDDLAAFAAALVGWLPAYAPAGPPRFLWLENPDQPSGLWQATGWFAAGPAGTGTVTWTTAGVNRFRLGGYRLQVAAGTALTLDADGAASFPAGSVRLIGPGDGFASSGAGGIPFQGPAIGCWCGPFTLPAEGMTGLGAGLLYALRHSGDEADPRLDAVAMPVLGTAAGSMGLTATWDPLNPMVRGRTGMVFGPGGPAIASGFVTQRGYGATLTPVDASSPLWPGGLMFGACASRIGADTSPGLTVYNLVPDGAFALAVTPPEDAEATDVQDTLVLGLSGLETAEIAADGTLLLFQPGQPAFAAGAYPGGTVPGVGGTLLTDLAVTAWISVLPAAAGGAGLAYYAQPLQAPLFTASGTGPMLPFQPVSRCSLSGYTAGDSDAPPAYPAGAYAGTGGAQAAAARALELAALAPLRSQVIAGLPGDAVIEAAVRAADGETVTVTTPRGLAMDLSADLSSITGVRIASLSDDDGPHLAFTGIGPDFQAALLSNQLFLVVSNATAFLEQATCVEPFFIDLDGWRFDVDPEQWRTGDAPTLMIWKYANRSLEALAADTAVWSWQAAAADADGSLTATWTALNRFLAEAREAYESGSDAPCALFYRRVASAPDWNGVLFLNAPVEAGDFPDSLQFIAAGLDPADFFAHHVGVDLTPVGDSQGQNTSVFGLIQYSDPVDLVPESTVPYAFKTTAMTAEFANAHLAAFTVEVELSLNQLFGASLLKQNAERGNNLLITGTLQETGGGPSYSFSVSGQNSFRALYSAVAEVEITTVRVESQSNPSDTHVTTSFALGGKLRFVAVDGFDLFSYGAAPAAGGEGTATDGWLAFSQLALVMDFPIDDPGSQIWTVNETGIGFDLANSRPRADSLVACFPVTPAGIVTSPDLSLPGKEASGLSPEDMGYPSIAAPLDQAIMVPPWYGLVLSLDLGGLGALLGGVGVKASLLAAWRVGTDVTALPVYLGLKLPGTPTKGGSFPLQGVLKLGFRSIVFSTYEQDGGTAYLLRLSRFTLSALGLSLPPGNLDISLFGGPQGRSTGQLGWLAAYEEDAASPTSPAVTPASIPSAGARPRALRRRRLGRLSGGA